MRILTHWQSIGLEDEYMTRQAKMKELEISIKKQKLHSASLTLAGNKKTH